MEGFRKSVQVPVAATELSSDPESRPRNPVNREEMEHSTSKQSGGTQFWTEKSEIRAISSADSRQLATIMP